MLHNIPTSTGPYFSALSIFATGNYSNYLVNIISTTVSKRFKFVQGYIPYRDKDI